MKKNKQTERTAGQTAIFVFIFILFVIYSVSLLYPLVWAVISSFKNGAIEYFSNSFGLPKKWIFNNYTDAFTMFKANNISFFVMLLNSTWFAVGGTLISVFVLSMFSYAVARFDFPCKILIINVSIIMMMIPVYGSLPATVRMYNNLGLINSPMILVTFTAAMGGQSFLITQSFFKNLPGELSESAKIDGANEWRIFFQIMLPMAKGILLSFGLLGFIGNWNNFMTPLLFLPKMPTLATGLFTYQTVVERSGNFPLYFSGIVLTMIPTLLLFTLLSKHLVKNISYGGIKG